MPLFDYKCSNCGHIEEVIIRLSQVDDLFRINLIKCERCGGVSSRQLSAPSHIIVRNNRIEKKRYEG